MSKLHLRSISRVALVDRGDNPEAHVLIHKRAVDPPPPAAPPADDGFIKRMVAEFAKLISKAPVSKADEATTFGDLTQARRMREATNEVWEFGWQWQNALSSILSDPDLDDETRAEMIATSNTQFLAAVDAAVPKWIAGETADVAKIIGTAEAIAAAQDEVAKSGKPISAARLVRLKEAHNQITAILAEVDPEASTETSTEDEPVAETTTEKNAPAAAPPATAPEDVLKSASPELQELFKAQLAATAFAQATATSALAKAEATEERAAIAGFQKRLADGGDLYGLPGVTAEALRTTEKALGAGWAAHETLLKASAAAIRQGGVLSEVGKTGDASAPTDAWGEIVAKAETLRATETALTLDQAISMVSADPANEPLMKRYRAR